MIFFGNIYAVISERLSIINNKKETFMNQEMIFCQSCAMPLQKDEDFGTNTDNSQNKEYCAYCFQKGKFTESDITMNEMIDKCVNTMTKMNLPQENIEKTKKAIPNLKRWKK